MRASSPTRWRRAPARSACGSLGFRDLGRMGDQEGEIEGRIQDLVEYVLSIQKAR
ncbi:MAG TPA: hypothetical protein VMT85_09985 [Thermoanaerobaculia bacterium]|nr:hypothetical protein [Thermoanaerobaculia bacterium]